MQSRKLDSLTGLRFIAALMVFAAHAYPLSGEWSLYFLGQAGVVLFFTLSGFVITYNYFDRFEQGFKGNLKSFLISRLARIYPLYFLLFLVGLLLNHRPAVAASLPFQITLTQSWFGNDDWAKAYNPVSWSLSVEFFLYLTFPFVIYPVLKRARTIPKLILVGGFVYALSMIYILLVQFAISGGSLTSSIDLQSPAYYLIYTCPLPHISDFFLGCVAARFFLLLKNQPVKTSNRVVSLCFLASVLISLLLMVQSVVPVLNCGSFNTPFIALGLLILARYSIPASRLLANRLFVLLGNASFAFYLSHYLVLYYLRPFLLPDYTTSPLLAFISLTALLVGITALSVLLYRLVESPARRFIINKSLKVGPVPGITALPGANN